MALIQGITEFLPISSSAHLILPSLLLDWPDQGLTFDVAVHLGTLFAVFFYFRRDVVALIRAWLIQITKGEIEDEIIHSKDNEIGKILIKGKFPFAVIKYKNLILDNNKQFKCGNANLKIIKPDWMK